MTRVYSCKRLRHHILILDLNAYTSKSNTGYQIVMATRLVINNRKMHIYKTWGTYKTNIVSIKDVLKLERCSVKWISLVII